MDFRDVRSVWSAFQDSPRGKVLLKGIRYLFTAGVFLYIGYELTRTGWMEVWNARPTTPLFYLIFLALYFSIPLFEVVIYRVTWRYDLAQGFLALLKKRIYNKEVIDYSGEVFFVAWARKHCDLTDRQVLETVRDNNILSSIASTTVAVILLIVFALEGRINLSSLLGEAQPWYAGAGLVLFAGALVAAARFRRYLFSMPLKPALLIGGLQVLRSLLTSALQIAQWAVVLPGVSLRVWFTYSALLIVVSRIPLLPNRDVVFVGLSTSLSGLLSVPTAAIASMMLMNSVLSKALSGALFGSMTVADRLRREPRAEPQVVEVAAVE